MDKVGPSKVDEGGPPGGAPIGTQDPLDPNDGIKDPVDGFGSLLLKH